MAQRIFGTRRQPRRARWVVLLLAVAAVGLVAAAAYAQPVAPAPQAGLLLRAEPEGPPVPAPILSTLVDIAVGGPVARTRVRQAFGNTAQAWLEGVYLFPLPEGAAVDRFRLRIGEQVIEGRIAEREAAEREYRTARKEGKLAGLLDRERPNVFTLSVANIPPGATVEVEIEYQETLRFQDGQLTLRFRMVVAPRYRPRGPVLANTGPEGGGIAPPFAPTPVMPPAGGAPNPLALRIALDPGFPLARLESRYHEVAIAELPDDRYAVRLAQGPVLADRDFELVWAPALGTAPAVGLFTEIVDGEGYLLAMIVPPEQPAASAPPRELVLVVDTSGSMAGTSLPQAKAALRHALARLRPRDRFNVIRFADTPSALFPTAREASERNRGRAAMFIDALDAEGGTEMAAALMWALATRAPDGYLRQIVFLTDGAIGNEAELFDLIRAGIGSSACSRSASAPRPTAISWPKRRASGAAATASSPTSQRCASAWTPCSTSSPGRS